MQENKEKLFEQHKHLIHKILYSHKISQSYTYFEDCYQAGCIGLLEAIESYDPEKAKLTTHAYYYIRRAIQYELSQVPTVYFGVYESMLEHQNLLPYSANFENKDGLTLLDMLQTKSKDQAFSDDDFDMVENCIKELKPPTTKQLNAIKSYCNKNAYMAPNGFRYIKSIRAKLKSKYKINCPS